MIDSYIHIPLTKVCESTCMTQHATDTRPLLFETSPGRRYSNSLFSVARDFWCMSSQTYILEAADALQKLEGVGAVAVVDSERRVCGIVLRETLFSIVGKPYGRDVLRRSLITDIIERPPMIEGNMNLFAATALMRDWDEEARRFSHIPLIDNDGSFQALLSIRDLSEHLARMTEDDIELAGILQERLVSGTDFLERNDVSINAWSRPAKGVGGDFYFVRDLEGGGVFAALCDVSGKGVAASIIVAMVWGFLKAFDFRKGLRELIVNLNQTVVSTFHMEKYLTGFFMVYKPDEQKLLCADMGHSHVFFIRNNKIMPVRSKKLNLPVGIEYDIDPAFMAISLKAADTLIIYSDGIVEQEDAGNNEFGEGQLAAFLLDNFSSGELLKTALPLMIDEYRGTVPQHDDMSVLRFHYKGLPAKG